MTDRSSDRAEILDLEERRQTALVAVDLPALDAMFADDLTHVHSSGLVHDKAEFLRHVERMGGFISIERGPLRVEVAGDLAVVTGTSVNRVRSLETGEEVTLDGFVTQVLRRGEGGWRFTLSQLTAKRRG